MNEDATHITMTTLLHPGGCWPDDVMLWHVRIPLAPTAWNRLQAWLSADEQQQALRYRRDEDRLRFAATRAVLRTLLARHIGGVPLSLRFSSGPFGRPELDGYGDTLSFNVTHAGQHALIALSDRRCVGVDIECMNRMLDWQALLGTVCTDDEQRALREGGHVRGAQGFFRCWTAKEAVLKALGVGIGYGLQQVSVDPFAQGVQRVDAPASGAWGDIAALQLHWINDVADYAGCIAFGPPGSVSARPRQAPTAG